MFTVLVVIHIVLCIGLIGFVLLQQGKGADAGATFGGSNAATVLGTGGADFATKLTTGMAIAFMVTSILLVRAYQTAEVQELSVVPANVLDGSVIGDAIEQEAESKPKAEAASDGKATVTKEMTKDEGKASAAKASQKTEETKAAPAAK